MPMPKSMSEQSFAERAGMTRGERREQKRRAARKMRVHGRSVFTIQRVQQDRAASLAF